MTRRSWNQYFLAIADDVSTRSTCLRAHWGAVLVDSQSQIISTGYNGAPAGILNCSETGVCRRQEKNVPSGSNVELCYAVHAEMNALLQAGPDARESTLYLSGRDPKGGLIAGVGSCILCAKMAVNASVKVIIVALGPKGEAPFVTTPQESVYARALEQGLNIPPSTEERLRAHFDAQGRISSGYYEDLFSEEE